MPKFTMSGCWEYPYASVCCATDNDSILVHMQKKKQLVDHTNCFSNLIGCLWFTRHCHFYF